MNQYQSNGNQYYQQQQTPTAQSPQPPQQINYNSYANKQTRPQSAQQQPPAQSMPVNYQLPSTQASVSQSPVNQSFNPPSSNPTTQDQHNSYGALTNNMETLSINSDNSYPSAVQSPQQIVQQPPVNKQQYQSNLFNNTTNDPRLQQSQQQQQQPLQQLQQPQQQQPQQFPYSAPSNNESIVQQSPSMQQINQTPSYGQPQFNGNQQYYANANVQSNVQSLNKPQPPLSGPIPPMNQTFNKQQAAMPNRYPPQPNYYPPQPPTMGGQMPPPPLQQQPYYGGQQHTMQSQYGHHEQYGHPGMMNQPPPQQPKQLNPDSVPSVIQVIDDDKMKWFEKMYYEARAPSDLPPNDTTIEAINPANGQRIKVADLGCTRPNHMRSSIYNVPSTEEMLKNTAIPFNVVIKPFDEFEVEEHLEDRIDVPVSPSEIVRCNRCKAYICPFMRFTDGGRRFQCAMCHHTTEVPNSYFVQLDHNEQRLDKYQRPELHLGSYEFRTNEDFYRNKLMASRRPHIVFAFELTTNSRLLIKLISENLADVIKNSLPHDVALNCPPPLVGFITYNSKIQLYDILNNGTSHIISDVANTFPSFTTFLIDPITHMDKIEEFLAKLPTLYSDNELETETILGPVIEAAFQTCNVDSTNWFANQDVKDKTKVLAVGKIYMFHCSLPTFGQDGATPGRLKKRWTTIDEEAKRLLGTDKEKNILTPEPSKYYTKLGEKCVTDYGSGVELFLFPPVNGSFLDIATISELTRLTGTGGIYKYFNDFSTRFLQDLRQSLKSTMAFDCLVKVRTSTGIRPVDYVGNFYSRNVSDIEIASLSAGNSISVEFKYDDKLSENEFVIIQVATLYTAVSGDRRVRIHNLALPTCNQLADVFRSANCDALVNHLFRSSIQSLRLGQKTIQDVKSTMINRVVQILTSYRRNCASPASSPGQLILPETLKLLPVYTTGTIKCDAIDGGFEMMPDEKAFAQARSLGANCSYSQVVLYPALLKLHYNEQCEGLEASPLRSAFYRLSESNGVAYVLENGFYLFLYLPNSPEKVDQPKFIRNVFGVQSINDIHPEKDLPQLETEESLFVHSLLNDIRKKRKMAMKVYIVRQGIDKNELIFKCFLYEDKKPLSSVTSGQSNLESPGYIEILCHIHKEIRALTQ